MAYREFVSLVHKSTKRDYVARVTQRDKADVAELAIKYDYDYWDGSRETGCSQQVRQRPCSGRSHRRCAHHPLL